MRLKVRMDGFKEEFKEDPTGYDGPFVDVCRFRPVRVEADLLRCCGEPRAFIGKRSPPARDHVDGRGLCQRT